MRTVVQKYGGTSVGTPERIQAIARRVAAHARTQRVAVVVSAMAGETNRLVALVRQVNPNASARSHDMAVAAGEQVSVGLMAAALEQAGTPGEPLLGHQLGILTDDAHGRARIRSIRTGAIEACWERGRIPVVAGFQGVTEANSITTLGRGGSDTSAVALAVALEADLCEINTDVDGVYTADPRVVPDARHVERLSYDTALEMAALGSKVLHPRCVELGAKFRLPLVVRSTFDPEDARRTLIMELGAEEALESPVVSGITVLKGVARVTVSGQPPISDLFTRIARAGVNVDVIVHDRHGQGVQSVGFTVPGQDLGRTVTALEGLPLEVKTQDGLAKVSAVGLGMNSHPGVASRLFETLHRDKVDILMITTSEIKISCVVPEDQADRAARSLHREFFS